jgi:hypothetical protein
MTFSVKMAARLILALLATFIKTFALASPATPGQLNVTATTPELFGGVAVSKLGPETNVSAVVMPDGTVVNAGDIEMGLVAGMSTPTPATMEITMGTLR